MFARLLTALLAISGPLFATVAIDIGHTPKHHGATSAYGFTEYDYNQRMASIIIQTLKEEGIDAFLVNPEGREISLAERTAIARERHASLFISIHHDSVNEKYLHDWEYKGKQLRFCDDFSGYALFVSKSNPAHEASYDLASNIGRNLRYAGMHPTRYHALDIKGERRELMDAALGVYAFDALAVLRTAEMPAVLIECGFIVSKYDEWELNKPKYQKAFAQSIAEAIKQLRKEEHASR